MSKKTIVGNNSGLQAVTSMDDLIESIKEAQVATGQPDRQFMFSTGKRFMLAWDWVANRFLLRTESDRKAKALRVSEVMRGEIGAAMSMNQLFTPATM